MGLLALHEWVINELEEKIDGRSRAEGLMEKYEKPWFITSARKREMNKQPKFLKSFE